jgi:hypothetical protein
MLRITGRTCEHEERLELEGQLTAGYLDELENALADAQARSGRLALDLTELRYLDADATRYLRELHGRGVAIHGCSGFVAQLLGVSGSAERSPRGRSRGGPCWS